MTDDNLRCGEILESIIYNSLLPQMIINFDGTFKMCNQAAKFMFKKLWNLQFDYASFNWKALPVWNSFSEAFLKDAEKAFQGDIIVNQYNLKYSDDSNTEYYYEFQFFPVYQKDDIINSVCICALDITNLKRKETLLLDSISINQSVFTSLDEPFLLTTFDLNYFNANELFFNTFNVRRSEIDASFFRRLEWKNSDINSVYIQNFKLKNESAFFKNEEDNLTSYFQVSSDIINLEDKRLIFFVFKNITDLQNEYKYSRLLLDSIEKSELGFLLFDKSGKLSYANKSVEVYFDFDLSFFQGKSCKDLCEHFSDNNFFTTIKDKIAINANWKGKISILSKNRKEEILDTNVYSLKTDTNRVEQYIVIFKNVSHEVHLEKHLQQAQKLEALGTLAGGIAHDFNNILTAMLGFTELCIMDTEENSTQFFNLKQIQVAANRARDMIHQILTFSRKTDIELKPLIVNPIIKEAAKLLRASLPVSIKIIPEIPAKPLKILGDPTQINQIVMNLATNSYHAMKNKSGTIKISLSLQDINENNRPKKLVLSKGKYILLSVSDDGCGIPEHVKNKIFDPYFTTKSAEEGTGLGLAVVHGIVSAVNGFISFESEKDKGTSFYIYIPVYEAGDSSEVVNNETHQRGDGQKILFIDDEEPIVNVNCQILKKLNYNPYGFTDPHKAYDFYVDNFFDIDVIITDMTMPHINGLEFVSMIRELNPIIPVIICTGYSEILEKYTIDDKYLTILVKPVSAVQLSTIISKLI